MWKLLGGIGGVVVFGAFTVGVVYFGAAPASASSSWHGTLNSGCHRNCDRVVRFFPNNDPGTLVRTVRVAVTWETNARLVGSLWCGSGRSINSRMARSFGHDGFLSLTVGVPNFYPRCEIWISRYSGPTTRFVMNVFGRNAFGGTFLRPADEASRHLELEEEIESMQLAEGAFGESVEGREAAGPER